MSKLHILQGISGTVKTSLPIAFARSLGRAGGKNFKVIEVQAGWRDRQDLIGYFNSFEGRFYETEFLTALYEAQCPEFQDQIYIIILDEMNLSRPEQYFADFLSKLEQDDPLLTLNTDLKRPSPTLFQERNTLAIPPNVWFVGTANQDETTLEFAKKTYDRAHVMELERNHPNFTLDYTPSSRHPISYKTLKTAFEDAQKNHAKAADRAFQFFKNDLEKLLGERFKVSWGNRLQRQMNHFIPVVLAAGGSLTEATDHILATKILRQIRDRHDIQAGDLQELQETIGLPISRAQRISPHATEFLASHTEDWEKRTIRKVRPKRVLCLIREDLLDIYENRVTVRLIDHLLEYLQKRISEVQALQKELEQIDDFSSETRNIHWRNRKRICSLWGEHFQDGTALKTAEETLKMLRQLQYKLRGLMDTELYRAIPKQAEVGNTLKRTNILINDQHYRYVDQIWQAWSPWKRGQTKNNQQIFDIYQQLLKGFESFCLLLISRALTGSGNENDEGLGFEAENYHIPHPSEVIQFNSLQGKLTLTWQDEGTFLIQSEGLQNLRLIPLLTNVIGHLSWVAKPA